MNNLGDHGTPLDLAALVFGQANDFNEIYRRALEQSNRQGKPKQEKENERESGN